MSGSQREELKTPHIVRDWLKKHGWLWHESHTRPDTGIALMMYLHKRVVELQSPSKESTK